MECISIHIGQAGVRVGAKCNELYCLEHGIQPNGFLEENKNIIDDNYYKTFFVEDESGKHTPTSLFIDSGSAAVGKTFVQTHNEIRNCSHKELFSSHQLLTEYSASMGTFARGRNQEDLMNNSLDGIRKLCEKCDDLQGFLIFHSCGGGTGSGFTSLLLEELHNEFTTKPKHEYPILPGKKMSDAIEPYNTVFSINKSLKYSNCIFMAENDALYDICSNVIDQPTHNNLNNLLSPIIAAITATLRYNGVLNLTFEDIQSSLLIPDLGAKFPLISYSPLLPKSDSQKCVLNTQDLVPSCLTPWNQMVKCDPIDGITLASCLLYRGKIKTSDIKPSISEIKQNVAFKPSGLHSSLIKVGINYSPIVHPPWWEFGTFNKSLCIIKNTTAITKVWGKLNEKFSRLFSKRAYVHWYYADGMEEHDFQTAFDSLMALESEYKNINLNLKSNPKKSKSL